LALHGCKAIKAYKGNLTRMSASLCAKETTGTIERGGIFMSGGGVYGGGFALLVVLFILLVIIGAAWL